MGLLISRPSTYMYMGTGSLFVYRFSWKGAPSTKEIVFAVASISKKALLSTAVLTEGLLITALMNSSHFTIVTMLKIPIISSPQYIRFAQTLKYYGTLQFKPCTVSYPEPGTKTLINAGNKELYFRVELPDGTNKEGIFKITRMRCWRITNSVSYLLLHSFKPSIVCFSFFLSTLWVFWK